jgi:cytochrome P450
MEATLILATIFQRFALELVPGQDLSPWVAPTVRPRHGLEMVVHSR